MYLLEMHCSKCNALFKVGESVTFHGLCSYDGTVLNLEFKTIGYYNNASS